MFVPTQHEVATLPGYRLFSILIDWMWENPSELIPDHHQIAEVRTILLARPDADDDDIAQLIAECDAYLVV
jgi:hypothetical protein